MDRKRIRWGHVRRLAHRGPGTRRHLKAMAQDEHAGLRALAGRIELVLHEGYAALDEDSFATIEAFRASCSDPARLPPGNWPEDLACDQVVRWATIGSKRPRWCRLLYLLVRAFAPQQVLELGTLIGVSGAYLGAAVRANGHGHVVTVDRNAQALGLARVLLRRLELEDVVEVVEGSFDAVLPSLLERLDALDLVFKDGDHSTASTVAWFERFCAHAAGRRFAMLFDDITWSAGMAEAWRIIEQAPAVEASVDFFNLGLVVVGPDGGAARRYRIAMP